MFLDFIKNNHSTSVTNTNIHVQQSLRKCEYEDSWAFSSDDFLNKCRKDSKNLNFKQDYYFKQGSYSIILQIFCVLHSENQ